MLKQLLIRWLIALVLVMVTFNPLEFSYVHWAINNFDSQLSLVILFGLILVVAYAVFIRATLRSIGKVGIGMIVAVIGVLLWVLYDNGLLNPANATLMTWIGLVALSIILGIGLSWSIIRRRISGQLDTSDVDGTHGHTDDEL